MWLTCNVMWCHLSCDITCNVIDVLSCDVTCNVMWCHLQFHYLKPSDITWHHKWHMTLHFHALQTNNRKLNEWGRSKPCPSLIFPCSRKACLTNIYSPNQASICAKVYFSANRPTCAKTSDREIYKMPFYFTIYYPTCWASGTDLWPPGLCCMTSERQQNIAQVYYEFSVSFHSAHT